jgi:fermentation-respiration switch protein FrsA (DUF1100 family)
MLAERAAELLPPDDQVSPLGAVLRGDAQPGELTPGARALYRLLSNRDPTVTTTLIDALPDGVRGLVEDFSPSRVIDRLNIPVTAMHSIDDPVVPYAEMLRLARARPETETISVSLLSHVDLVTGWRSLPGDVAGVWRFANRALEGGRPRDLRVGV